MATKKDSLIPNSVFKEYIKNMPEKAIQLSQACVQYLNFKEDNGSINDYVRLEVI